MMKNSRNSREGVHNKKGLLIVQEGRIEWMDAAKGYGILLVVFAHLGIGAIPTSYLNSFYMPLFFFLSGYVFSPKCEAKRFLHNKTKSILLPYFALGFPMLIFEVVVNCIIGKATFSFGIDLFVKFLIQRRLWTIWYLTCLFVAINFFYLIIRHLNSIVSGIVILLLFILTMIYYSVGGIELPWNIDVVPVAMLFLYDGYLFKNLQFSNKIDLLPMKKTSFYL